MFVPFWTPQRGLSPPRRPAGFSPPPSFSPKRPPSEVLPVGVFMGVRLPSLTVPNTLGGVPCEVLRAVWGEPVPRVTRRPGRGLLSFR